LQKVRGLIAAAVVGMPLWCLLFFSLHATREIAAIAAAGVGLAIFAVVATGTDARDARADAAWREAAPDLPPSSDRIALDRSQATMPGPDRGRRTGRRHRDERQGVHTGDAATPGAPPT
jgi:hypothetical protein